MGDETFRSSVNFSVSKNIDVFSSGDSVILFVTHDQDGESVDPERTEGIENRQGGDEGVGRGFKCEPSPLSVPKCLSKYQ